MENLNEENEDVWGEEEVFESLDVYKTVSTMGFRDGKQYAEDIKRQEGFNAGFKIGQEIGKLYGKFLALIAINNIELEEKLLNYKEFDSIESFVSELKHIKNKLDDFPLEVREQFNILKSKLEERKLFI